MKVSSCNQFMKIFDLLKDLKKKYPSHNIGRHISLAMSDYPDLWSVSDKEFSFALEKYIAELEMNIVSDREIEAILSDDFMDISDPEDEE